MDNEVWFEKEIRELKERVERLEKNALAGARIKYEETYGVRAHARFDSEGYIEIEPCCSHCAHE